VVTVMGHVDHGKTSLLDTIRKTDVAEGEYGGITQHIGAYQVETEGGTVTFLDTPGHAAFTAMRARGAQVTDIVILIVAADDGLMPQTIEAIHHARAADVPIVVAINKIDLPGANIQKVKNELMQHELIGEDLGGDTIICEVSAKTGEGVENLLEMLLLQSEILELKSAADIPAEGVVIESEVDPQTGIRATILVKSGTLRKGDVFVSGDVSGRVRLMIDDRGNEVEEAPPAFPVEIFGLDGCPDVGEKLLVLEDERQAREIAETREQRRRRKEQNRSVRPHVTLEGLADFINEDDKPKELHIILKADVQGSVEAVRDAMERMSTEKVNIRIIHGAVGAINESDVQLAMASDAIVIGFNVRADTTANDLSSQEGIDIKTYRVIYELLEDLSSAMLGMLDKKFKEVTRGQAEIRDIFKISRLGNIAGCHVIQGSINRNDSARLMRDGTVVYEGKFSSLRRVKDDVREVNEGYECGITLENYQDIKQGDIIESFYKEEVEQTL
jgi:translation initiation factor IF-2